MTDKPFNPVVAVMADTRWHTAPRPHQRGEAVMDVVFADPGTNGFYYREQMPDSVAAFVRVDHVRALLAEAKPPIHVDVAGAMDKMTPDVIAAMAPLLLDPIVKSLEMRVLELNEKCHKANVERSRWQERWEATDKALGEEMAKLAAAEAERDAIKITVQGLRAQTTRLMIPTAQMEGGHPIMHASDDLSHYWIDGHDIADARESFGAEVAVRYYMAFPSGALCQDEGCDHYGTHHVCECKQPQDEGYKLCPSCGCEITGACGTLVCECPIGTKGA